MQLASDALISFLTALHLRPEATEAPTSLSLTESVPGQALIDLDYRVVAHLIGAYGESLKADVLFEDLKEFTIGPSLTGQVFKEAKTQLVVAGYYELRLRVDKDALLNAALGSEEARRTVHYFFATSVESLIARGLGELEDAIWGTGATEARRLLVGDTDLQRLGPAFEVLGGTNLTAISPFRPMPQPLQTTVERIRGERAEHVSWDYQWVQGLTPVQLQLDGAPGHTQLEKLLAASYIQLCLLYTCDRARRRSLPAGSEVQLEYRGAQLSVRVSLQEAQPITTEVTAATIHGFADLVDWCYRLRDEGTTTSWTVERLQFAQVRIVQLLRPIPDRDRLTTLVDQIAAVVEALDDQWRAFIEDRFGEYLESERQLEDVISDVVATSSEKTTALTKNLSDTLLAAVAVLLGSAIAAAFKTPFNAALFRVGTLAYAGYVVIFPGIYGLGAQVDQFLQISRIFDYDKSRFSSLLGAKKTEQIVADRVALARRRYWIWFALTVVGYVIAVAGAIAAAAVVPSIVT